ncbi:MAG: hypothetical protein JWO62_3334 [Acidimicrobiaceae bacterium]|nr:hypothetical protein [Acidimicrobiaceae bacterium]
MGDTSLHRNHGSAPFVSTSGDSALERQPQRYVPSLVTNIKGIFKSERALRISVRVKHWCFYDEAGFPRYRVLRRALGNGSDQLSRPRASVVIAVLFAVVSVLWVDQTSPTILIQGVRVPTAPATATLLLAVVVGSLIGALVGYGLPWCISITRNLRRYRIDRDRDWTPTGHMSGNAVQFCLTREADAMPDPFTKHGRMECIICAPDGSIHVVEDNEMSTRDDNVVLASWFTDAPGIEPLKGMYEVRWYGSKKRGKFHEITRGTYDLQGASGQHVASLDALL